MTATDVIKEAGWLHNEETGRIPQRVVISMMEKFARLKSKEDNAELVALLSRVAIYGKVPEGLQDDIQATLAKHSK